MNLLLAGKGDRATIACIRSLEKAGYDYRIALPAERFVSWDPYDIFWRLSPYRKKILADRYEFPDDGGNFITSLKSIAQAHGQLLVYPLSEKESQLMVEHKEELRRCDIDVPLPNLEVYEQLSSKYKLSALAKDYDIDVPTERPYNEVKTEYPFVAKPKQNISETGEKNTPYLIFHDRQRLSFEDNEILDEYFFQEYIDGTSFYYCCLFDTGQLRGHFTQETVRQQPNGKSVVKAVPSSIPDSLQNRINDMLIDLNYHGPIMFEFREHQENYYLIEANPRFWGPLQLAVDNGVDFPQGIAEMRSDDKRDVGEQRAITGYRWTVGYLNGMWEKLLKGGQFEKNHSDSNYATRDVFLRWDTFHNLFIYDLLAQGLTPASVLVRR